MRSSYGDRFPRIFFQKSQSNTMAGRKSIRECLRSRAKPRFTQRSESCSVPNQIRCVHPAMLNRAPCESEIIVANVGAIEGYDHECTYSCVAKQSGAGPFVLSSLEERLIVENSFTVARISHHSLELTLYSLLAFVCRDKGRSTS